MAHSDIHLTAHNLDFKAMQQEAQQAEANYHEQLQALKACLDDLKTLESNHQLDTATLQKIHQAIQEAQTQISAIELTFGTAPSTASKKAHRYHQAI